MAKDKATKDLNGNGWSKWEKYIVLTLKDVKADVRNLYNKIDESKTLTHEKTEEIIKAVTTLQVKSGVWGLVGGMIPVAILIVIWLVRTNSS